MCVPSPDPLRDVSLAVTGTLEIISLTPHSRVPITHLVMWLTHNRTMCLLLLLRCVLYTVCVWPHSRVPITHLVMWLTHNRTMCLLLLLRCVLYTVCVWCLLCVVLIVCSAYCVFVSILTSVSTDALMVSYGKMFCSFSHIVKTFWTSEKQ